MRAMFDRWDHDRDAVLRDLDPFFDLLLHSPEQFSPLLTHALDGNGFGTPNPFGFRISTSSHASISPTSITSKRKLKQLVDEGHRRRLG